MKPSELRNIIKEEIGKALSENVEMDKMNQTFNDKVGVKSADPSVKNTMKKKEFKVEFQQYINDDYDVDFITVKAEDEADALIKAKEELKKLGKRNVRFDKLKVIK